MKAYMIDVISFVFACIVVGVLSIIAFYLCCYIALKVIDMNDKRKARQRNKRNH